MAHPDPFDDVDAELDISHSTAAAERDVDTGERQVSILKPPLWDVHTTLLGVALVAILFSCVLMILELQSYGFRLKP
jgi:hypothetical protein